MVAEITAEDAKVTVNRIVAAVDVGVAVNPDVIQAQVEGAVGFALSAVLRNRITLKDGVVQERNFDTYEPTRMREMPAVEVHIMPSSAAPYRPRRAGRAGDRARNRQRDLRRHRPAPALAAAGTCRAEGRVTSRTRLWHKARSGLRSVPRASTRLPNGAA